MTTVLKGFIIPAGYVLTIASDTGDTVTKYPGEYSGGHYTREQVESGAVPSWNLNPINVTPPQDTELQSILTGLHLAGGEALFVGGIVRDLLSGRENKDIDIEVYGIAPESLQELLSAFGKVDTVGASFGIIKLTTPTNDYDFSLPRRENKTGAGHKGFLVETDPDMSPEDAAARRDFTINSLAMTHEGKVLDFFGGVSDLKNGVLRHTSNHYVEDPLRVLRGFQFAARFNLRMDERTARLSNGIRNEYADLARERIWGEWDKWATKGVVPSAGIQVLRDTRWIELYPELLALEGVKQDAEWHPEGDVLEHTMHVVDAASEIATRERLTPQERLILMFAALCHDFGKPETTQFLNGRWRAPGHAQAGERPTRDFLRAIGAPSWLEEQVVPLVVEHMAHVSVEEMTPRVVRRIANRVSPSNIKMLSYVIEADHSGRPPLPAGLPPEASRMVAIADELAVTLDKPKNLINGKDLLQLADDNEIPEVYMRPGAHFGVLLRKLYELQLDGEFTTREEGFDYLRNMFNESRYQEREETAQMIQRLSYLKMTRLIDTANRLGLSEEELLNLPASEIRKMYS